MLIPSIDLRNGKVVQLVQGERLALEDADLDKWIQRFAAFAKLQLIDLDAAIGTGSNDTLVRYRLRGTAVPRRRRHPDHRAGP
jgi:phosphoribosylformimino-5-aminoimidazole carboxamide ribonucleotide (ProFAR) isomerase